MRDINISPKKTQARDVQTLDERDHVFHPMSTQTRDIQTLHFSLITTSSRLLRTLPFLLSYRCSYNNKYVAITYKGSISRIDILS